MGFIPFRNDISLFCYDERRHLGSGNLAFDASFLGQFERICSGTRRFVSTTRSRVSINDQINFLENSSDMHNSVFALLCFVFFKCYPWKSIQVELAKWEYKAEVIRSARKERDEISRSELDLLDAVV